MVIGFEVLETHAGQATVVTRKRKRGRRPLYRRLEGSNRVRLPIALFVTSRSLENKTRTAACSPAAPLLGGPSGRIPGEPATDEIARTAKDRQPSPVDER